jgi:hypothetical protein
MKYLCLIHCDNNVIAAMSQKEMTALEEEQAYDENFEIKFYCAEALKMLMNPQPKDGTER